MPEIDFGNGVNTNITNDNNANDNQEDKTPLDGKQDIVDVNANPENNGGNDNNITPLAGNDNGDNNNNNNNDGDADDSSTGGLEQGTEIEYEGVTYTVDENGNVVDAEGKIFKEAKDVDAWLKENEFSDSDEQVEIPLKDVIEKIGIEIKDEAGNPVEFTNDAAGLESYINSVAEIKSNEASAATLNKFYQDNPVVKQFVDYLTVNGGNPRGFGEIPDRSGIVVDKDNEHQQEQIIRVAATEFGNKSVTDAYIKYLKDSGALYDEAVSQLQALKEKDANIREQIKNEAEIQRKAEEQAVNEYFEKVNQVITSRNIGGYTIPENFVKEVDGQKINLTPRDFYEYLYKQSYTDADGNKLTGYQKDLAKLSNDELLNNELINAWLLFTGGTFKDLAVMAAKEREVRKLTIAAKKHRTTRTIKINKPKNNGNNDDLLLS